MHRARTHRVQLARRVATSIVALAVAGLATVACGGDSEDTTLTIPPTPRIVVTSIAGDAESQLLAAVYSRALEDAGFRVVRRDPVDLDRAGTLEALKAGTIQLIPDWSGDLLSYLYDQPSAPSAPTTILPDEPATTAEPVTIPTTTTIPETTTTIAASTTVAAATSSTSSTVAAATSVAPTITVAGATTTSSAASTSSTSSTSTSSTTSTSTTTTTIAPNGRGSVEQLTALTAALPEGVSINSGSLAQKQQQIACSTAAFKANSDVEFATYTNLASIAPRIVLGAPAAWSDDDEFGLGAWTAIYGGKFKEIVTVEAADLVSAVDDETADCFVVDSLDTNVSASNLTFLTDDRTMVRANVAIALMSAGIATPDVLGALDLVASALTTERLNQMVREVTVNGTDPTVVANAFVDTL